MHSIKFRLAQKKKKNEVQRAVTSFFFQLKKVPNLFYNNECEFIRSTNSKPYNYSFFTSSVTYQSIEHLESTQC